MIRWGLCAHLAMVRWAFLVASGGSLRLGGIASPTFRISRRLTKDGDDGAEPS
jgi:hypothetical protein